MSSPISGFLWDLYGYFSNTCVYVYGSYGNYIDISHHHHSTEDFITFIYISYIHIYRYKPSHFLGFMKLATSVDSWDAGDFDRNINMFAHDSPFLRHTLKHDKSNFTHLHTGW